MPGFDSKPGIFVSESPLESGADAAGQRQLALVPLAMPAMQQVIETELPA
jgi:hypothetical protein